MNLNSTLLIGLDVGSTTVKVVVLNQKSKLLFSIYRRHKSEVRKTVLEVLQEVLKKYPENGRFSKHKFKIALTGSGSLSLARKLNLDFVQEVVASSLSIQKNIHDADVMIELGGEDAKLTFLTGGVDLRMNETCAGGTGAFIDQMAVFLNLEVAELDALALQHKNVYPIASRCGVFAKTDIVPLINEGCSKNDIAVSILQAVVNQFIGGLARGRSIKGKVVFLGGPLAFIKSLQKCFVRTLKLDEQHAIFPQNAELFVALGAALYAGQNQSQAVGVSLQTIINNLQALNEESETEKLPPLFANEKEIEEFNLRHRQTDVIRFSLEQYEGSAFLGIDSGSTTLKVVLIDDQSRLLYSHYTTNKGDPLKITIDVLRDLYARKKEKCQIVAAGVTGYGSALLKAGLCLDLDEVETVAHCIAAKFFAPEVSCILDIGGQDIKCMRVQRGVIERIQLNEACSAGCGSFIENFANAMSMSIEEFVQAAIHAQQPVDLGTRCTVFMNSKVKQAQKDGIAVGDIAAGLSYSVVRNACYKVIKINNIEELGNCIVAQGGAFLNSALLRALEKQIGKPVIRPSVSGLMGAFGMALLVKKNGAEGGKTKLLDLAGLNALQIKTSHARCKQCTNNCMLTVTSFGDNRRFVSGNRCERGAGVQSGNRINMFSYKYKRMFESYLPLAKEQAPKGIIGIPRALNIYENYPLWFTLLTELGFRVELSSPSSKNLFFSGYNSIPSQTVCYPAKMSHGHIMDLISRKVDYIFFPCLPREETEFVTQDDNYNCPVVIGYPDLLQKNISELTENKIEIIAPFLPMNRKLLAKRLRYVALFADFSIKELEVAVNKAFVEMDRVRQDIQKEGERALVEIKKSGIFGVVLAGHPYHVDPAINHGIPELINSCGMAVLLDDAVSHLMPDPGPLKVVDQWTYHSRLYRAGAYVAEAENLAILQLISFGCGLDAVSSDQLEEIVTLKGRLYAQIKIDEGINLGPAKIRIRSLLAAMKDRQKEKPATVDCREYVENPPFTMAMKDTHTILIPQLSPMHFQFMGTIFSASGYKVEQLPRVDKQAVELGLRYVNNDACFPAIVVVGQLLQAIKSGKYDSNKIAVMIHQTGGACRSTNYIAFLKKALQECGLEHIPIISMNMSGSAQGTGFRLTGKMLRRAIIAGYYGDALLRMVHRTQPYEAQKGSAMALARKWSEKVKRHIISANPIAFDVSMFKMIREFDSLPLRDIPRKPRVGLVGEILLKYHPDANNQAAKIVEQEGGEAVVPDIMDFAFYSFYDHIFNYKHLSGSWKAYIGSWFGIAFLEYCRWSLKLGFRLSQRFSAPLSFRKLRKKVDGIVSLGHQTGEGWLLVAEIVEMLESGVNNILCMQPFGCLPSHIVGKGMIKKIKEHFPEANIIALDYDPGASEVNQVNRIKLMMSIAK
ncbi:MAG: 2-hydroxyacyl-CoA dehydratase [Deltaproteobacteria bacterium]|jgi:predicted CoA-substrate-specific enzyme activase|nr:2-hydroxyacyl-CoA dehydratase [Deltaproteobacteria bacterium]